MAKSETVHHIVQPKDAVNVVLGLVVELACVQSLHELVAKVGGHLRGRGHRVGILSELGQADLDRGDRVEIKVLAEKNLSTAGPDGVVFPGKRRVEIVLQLELGLELFLGLRVGCGDASHVRKLREIRDRELRKCGREHRGRRGVRRRRRRWRGDRPDRGRWGEQGLRLEQRWVGYRVEGLWGKAPARRLTVRGIHVGKELVGLLMGPDQRRFVQMRGTRLPEDLLQNRLPDRRLRAS